ncbi:hypothetical protein [Desulfofundulus luciae]|nr:hypothetical protein [Desulfofundulus luciae]
MGSNPTLSATFSHFENAGKRRIEWCWRGSFTLLDSPAAPKEEKGVLLFIARAKFMRIYKEKHQQPGRKYFSSTWITSRLEG